MQDPILTESIILETNKRSKVLFLKIESIESLTDIEVLKNLNNIFYDGGKEQNYLPVPTLSY